MAVEDGKVSDAKGLIEGDELQQSDKERVQKVLTAIIADGRIEAGTCEKFMKR